MGFLVLAKQQMPSIRYEWHTHSQTQTLHKQYLTINRHTDADTHAKTAHFLRLSSFWAS